MSRLGDGEGEGGNETERRWTVRARRGDDETGGEKTAVVLVDGTEYYYR